MKISMTTWYYPTIQLPSPLPPRNYCSNEVFYFHSPNVNSAGSIAYSHSVFSPTSNRPSMLHNFTPAAMMHSQVTPSFFVGMTPTQITFIYTSYCFSTNQYKLSPFAFLGDWKRKIEVLCINKMYCTNNIMVTTSYKNHEIYTVSTLYYILMYYV